MAKKLLKPDVSPVRWSWANQHSSQHAVKCTNLNSRMPAPGPHSFPAPAHTQPQGTLCFRSHKQAPGGLVSPCGQQHPEPR